MPESCVCYGCTNRRKRGKRFSFHKFPLDNPDLLRRWLTNINRDKFSPTKHHRVCSEHFLSSDFMRGLHPRDDNFAITHRLNCEAAPTVFPGLPQCKKQHRHLLRNGPHSKKIRKEKPDVQQLVLTKEDVLEEQRPNVDQQDPAPVHIKKEEEEDWSSLETEQLNRTIMTDVSGFGFTSNPLKSEDDEDKPFPLIYVYQVEDGDLLTSISADPVKASTEGEVCAEIEITWNPDDTDSCSSETSISEVDEDEEPDSQLSNSSDSRSTSEDSDSGWKESSASASGVKTIINSFTFSDHGEQFGTIQSLQRDVTRRSGRTSSTCFVNKEDVNRRTAKRPRCGKFKKKVPTFMGDHNYA